MERLYYLVTSLPTLPGLGERPPLSAAELRGRAAEHAAALAAIDAVLLADDLLQRQSVLAGEDQPITPVVLSADQVRGEEPLPPELRADATLPGQAAGVEQLWERYFRHAAAVGAASGCAFLGRWVGFEVALRNALAEARAKTLRLSSEGSLVAADLSQPGRDVQSLVERWQAADTPLEALRALDSGRLEWLADNGSWFSFSIDELAAYAAALSIVARWERITPNSRG